MHEAYRKRNQGPSLERVPGTSPDTSFILGFEHYRVLKRLDHLPVLGAVPRAPRRFRARRGGRRPQLPGVLHIPHVIVPAQGKKKSEDSLCHQHKN